MLESTTEGMTTTIDGSVQKRYRYSLEIIVRVLLRDIVFEQGKVAFHIQTFQVFCYVVNLLVN